MKINWLACQYNQLDSYARYSTGMMRALMGLEVEVRPLLIDTVTMPQWMVEQERIDWNRLTISCMPAINTQPAPTGTRHWLLSMWETSRLPTQYAEQINDCGFERVIVPCKAVEDGFRQGGVTAPIHVIPGGVDPEQFPQRLMRWWTERGIDTPYTFLAMADRASRKGWMEVWEAFYKAFGRAVDMPDVRLVIKCRKDGNENVNGLAQAENRDPRIVFWDEDIADPAQIYAAADCFAIPSRFEGWGLPAREAACTGMPVITQAYSGMDDGHTHQWAIVVEKGQTQQMFDPDGELEMGEWRKCDVDELAERMSQCYRNPRWAATRGKWAAKWLRDAQTWQHSALALMQLIREHSAMEPISMLQAELVTGG